MYCTACRNEMDADAAFCSKCGKRAEPPIYRKQNAQWSVWTVLLAVFGICAVALGLAMLLSQMSESDRQAEQSGQFRRAVTATKTLSHYDGERPFALAGAVLMGDGAVCFEYLSSGETRLAVMTPKGSLHVVAPDEEVLK